MNESILKNLRGQLVLVDLIGSYQERELVFQNKADRAIKIFIYCEPNHHKPHIHIYFKSEHSLSLSIEGCEKLAGNMPAKYLKPILKWVGEYRIELLQAWSEIQSGKKPQLEWVRE